MMLKTTDAFSRLQPRHVSRRERTPGARERHSAQRQRLLTEHDGSRQQGQNIHGQQTVATKVNKSSYSMDSAVTDFSRNYPRTHEIKPDVVISRYKELSTIDEIRANIKSTSRTKSAPPRHVPDWMLNLDINLDVTSVDIIPPFNEQDNRDVKQETYTESPSFAYVDNDTDVDEDDDWEENLNDRQFGCNVNQTGSIVDEKNTSGRNENASPVCDTRRIMSNTFKKAERFSPESYQLKHESPRRYQGDKRVMSLQQGGIRSTPMQPKSKKFINQMITYHHMKHHDRKLKKAKPAVDTKMPSTFKYALDRKQLVEQRLNQSWSRAEQTSTPSKSPTMSNKPHSTPRDSR